MTKKDAKQIFGGRDEDLANAIGVTRTAVVHWPDILSLSQADRVIGAAVRLGRIKPEDLSNDPRRISGQSDVSPR